MADVIGLSKGEVITYRTLAGPRLTTHGKPGVREIFSVGDFSGDGRADLLAINNRGLLVRYTLNARGQISSTTQVGHGWTGFR